MSGSTSQPKLNPSNPQPFTIASIPRPGFRIHFHAVPVTIIESAMG